MAELIEINVSGRIEINATIINPTIYFEILKLSANLAEYFVAIVAPFITISRATIKMNKLLIINLFKSIQLERCTFRFIDDKFT